MIVDEFSMMSADLFYNLHLRLQEIKQNEDIFGGLSILFFGDLLQLRPGRARYIFECPKSFDLQAHYHVRNLFNYFSFIELKENHRQEKEGFYADIVNRVRYGEYKDDDLNFFKSRVVKNLTSLPEDAVYIFGDNDNVSKFNNIKLSELPGKLFHISAINKSDFDKKFNVDKSGLIFGAPLMAEFKFKIGAHVTLTYNISTLDLLTNGARGVVIGVEKENSKVKAIMLSLMTKRRV